MSSKWNYLFYNAVDWVFRRKSPFAIALTGSLTLLGVILGIGGLTGTFKFQDISIEVSPEGSVPSFILTIVVLALVIVIILSFAILVLQFITEHRASNKKMAVVIEGRGLRDDTGNPLIDALGKKFPKNKLPILLDLRQNMDGKIHSPENLLPKVGAMKESLNQVKQGKGRENTIVIYGGLTSVPFTFLTGVELDDEGEISIFDWDRTAETWRQLDADDDGKRLSTPDLQTFEETESVVLAISVSYPISNDDIATTFDYPIVNMELDGASSNSHWSASKQTALADQFFEFSKELSAKGVKNIHLIFAAPNSVVFQFGRRYDKRNLPNLIVYQYERSNDVKYPWGVQMPVGEETMASIVKR